MPPKVTYRITAGKKGGMIATAIIADSIQLLFKFLWFTGILAVLSEAVGWAMSGLASLLLVLAFAGSGVNPMSGASGKTRTLVAIACEGMPLINAMPTLTIWTALTIRKSRAEDKEKAAQSATIEQREAALRRGSSRRVRREQGDGRSQPRMRRILRTIPHPAFRAMGAVRTTRPSVSSAPKKNAL